MAFDAEQGLGQGESGTRLKTSPEPIIQVRDLVKVYETGAGGFTAIDGISLDVHRGEFLGVIGKSGAGKTTLLNLISGVSEVTSGEVLFYPRDNGSRREQRKAISVELVLQIGLLQEIQSQMLHLVAHQYGRAYLTRFLVTTLRIQ